MIDTLYHPLLCIGYEPQMWAVGDAEERLRGRPNIEIRSVALGAMGLEHQRWLWEYGTDAASFHREGQRQGAAVTVRDISEEWPSLGHVDLVVMNCEGAEFELLPAMLRYGYLPPIARLAVQFHLGLGNDAGYEGLRAEIGETHDLVVDEPAWTYWVRKGL